MPRLSPEKSEAREREIERRILEFWNYRPVVIDATKAELAEIEAEVEWWETHDEPPPGWTPDPPILDEQLIPVSRLVSRLSRNQRALASQRDAYRLYMQGKGIREIARRLNKPVTSIQRALDTAILYAGRRLEVGLRVHMEQCRVCSNKRFCSTANKILDSEAGTHYQREKLSDNKSLDYEAFRNSRDGHSLF